MKCWSGMSLCRGPLGRDARERFCKFLLNQIKIVIITSLRIFSYILSKNVELFRVRADSSRASEYLRFSIFPRFLNFSGFHGIGVFPNFLTGGTNWHVINKPFLNKKRRYSHQHLNTNEVYIVAKPLAEYGLKGWGSQSVQKQHFKCFGSLISIFFGRFCEIQKQGSVNLTWYWYSPSELKGLVQIQWFFAFILSQTFSDQKSISLSLPW